jgi:hypothetical protein
MIRREAIACAVAASIAIACADRTSSLDATADASPTDAPRPTDAGFGDATWDEDANASDAVATDVHAVDGGCSPHCDPGAPCGAPNDCTSSVCTQNVCQAPSCTDGAKNGLETGVDCGGACLLCDGDPCTSDQQCKSGACFEVCVSLTCSATNYAVSPFTTPNGAQFMTNTQGTSITGMTSASDNHPIITVPNVTTGSRYQIHAEVLLTQVGEVGVVFNASATGAYAMGSRYGLTDDPDLIQFTAAGMWNPAPLQIGPTFTAVAGTTYAFTLEVRDLAFRGKLWDRSTAEPSAWQVTGNLPTLPTDTGVGFYTYFTFQATLLTLHVCEMTP